MNKLTTAALLLLITFFFSSPESTASTPAKLAPQRDVLLPQKKIIFLPPPSIKLPPSETPIEIRKMDISVEVSGLEAETTTTITFFNPNGRVMEGELEFPLQDDATVSGYGLDVSGKMIDGVIVTQEKARVVLETEMRRGVDPGTVEHVKGNFFRTRVYPLPPRGERTIKIVTVGPLVLSGKDAAMQIPLPHRVKLPELNLELRVNSGTVKPVVSGFGNLTFSTWKENWRATATLKNVVPDNDLFLNLPKLPAQLVKVEEFDGEHFVSISDSADLKKQIKLKVPKRIGIAWDASSSRSIGSLEKDIAFLRKLFQKWREVEVDVVIFRDRVQPTESFKVKGAMGPELFKHLERVYYDGATDIGQLNFEVSSPVRQEQWFLFTDGLTTLGKTLPKFGGAPVHVVASDSQRDVNLQRFLAMATGGQFIDLLSMDTQAAVDSVTHPSVALLRVEAPRGALEEVQTRYYPAAGRSQVYARLKQDTTVTLVYGTSAEETSRSTLQVKKKDSKKNHIQARSWASAKAMELSLFPEAHQAELLKLGRRYNLVTAGTSLIVLERVSQYLEHQITPPASMPQWREEYSAALKKTRQNKDSLASSKIEQVVRLWNQRVDWFNQKFSYDPDFKFENPVLTKGSPKPQAPARAMKNKFKNTDSLISGGPPDPSIIIKEWNPTTPYLTAIKKVPKEAYNVYLEQKETYRLSPAFYLDSANYFFKVDKKLAVRILSNLAELKLLDPHLLRVLGWRLHEAGDLDRAIEVMEKVRALRPEEPQSHRDLALLLAGRLERDKNIEDGVEAAKLLNQVITGQWTRFDEVEVIVVMELNHLLERMEKLKPRSTKKLSFIDPRLRILMDLDVRITLTWDADNTDMDLHVIEPSGEEAFFSHNRTTTGGLVSRDMTGGYGPEEYVVRKAHGGKYKILCKYYGSQRQNVMGPVTVSATVITNFGRSNEKRELLTLRLSEQKELVEIGEITFGSPQEVKD
ncbi:MAG TPA: VIT domain-containing protein [Bacteriovoracaceae bacterium]|nr:VIT domain-containing protein [Bacteriovoracaceae bacterium]